MRTGYAVKALVGASVGAALLMGVAVTPSHATAVTLTGTGPGGRSASVTFDTFSLMGINYLTVVLTNTATYDSQIPTEILTAIFFSLPGDPTLSRTDGVSGAYTNPLNGSDIKAGPDVLNIGAEWAYQLRIVGERLQPGSFFDRVRICSVQTTDSSPAPIATFEGPDCPGRPSVRDHDD